MEDFKGETFGEAHRDTLVIFAIATHYEGDPCDNYKKAYKWLRDARKDKGSSQLFKGVQYLVFGLGDSSYEMYNVMGKFFNEAMEEMGATRVYGYGEGNAEGNKTEDDFNAWKLALWEELSSYYESNPIKHGGEPVRLEEAKKEGPAPAVSGKQLPLVLEVN